MVDWPPDGSVTAAVGSVAAPASGGVSVDAGSSVAAERQPTTNNRASSATADSNNLGVLNR